MEFQGGGLNLNTAMHNTIHKIIITLKHILILYFIVLHNITLCICI